MDQQNKQRQKSAFGGSGFDDTLSVTHEVKAPSIEEVLRAAKSAVAQAQKTIKAQRGGLCGCFGSDD